MERYFYRSRTSKAFRNETKKDSIGLSRTIHNIAGNENSFRAPLQRALRSSIDPELSRLVLNNTSSTSYYIYQDTPFMENERSLTQKSFSNSSSCASNRTLSGEGSVFSNAYRGIFQAQRARIEIGMDHLSSAPNDDKIRPRSAQYEISQKIRVRNFREDFYSTGLATSSSWVRGPWEDASFVHSDTSRQLIWNIVATDLVLYSDGANIQTWSAQWGLRIFLRTRPAVATITCISVSHFGFVSIGYESGNLILVDLLGNYPVSSFKLSDSYAGDSTMLVQGASLQSKHEVYPTSLSWLHQTRAYNGSDTSVNSMERFGRQVEFIVGDSRGKVAKIAVMESRVRGFNLSSSYAFPAVHCHSDSICSSATNCEETYLVVGGSDSSVKVWSHAAVSQPTEFESMAANESDFSHEVPQKSAVRALSFGPSNEVYATGGGRHDRTSRVYEIQPNAFSQSSSSALANSACTTSELLCEIAMPAQIVDVVWSNSTEILVALGHSRVKGYQGSAKIVDIRNQVEICEIPGEGYSLEAAKTQQGFCITTSTNVLYNGKWRPRSATYTRRTNGMSMSR